MTPRSANLAGIGLMLLGMFLFCCNDALGKWLLGTYSLWQMLLIRSIAAMLILAPFLWREGRAVLAAPRPGLQIVRVLLSVADSLMFFFAVTYLPLADTVTLYLAAPIYVTALSALFLKEQVGWRRWSAVLVGFIGVIIALRPSTAMFTLPALIGLAGGVVFAMFNDCHARAARHIRHRDGERAVRRDAADQRRGRAVRVDCAEQARFRPADASGLVAMVAFLCVNRSLKLAPASVVVPYQYTMIVWAVALGWLVFGDVPDAFTLTGAAIIIAAGSISSGASRSWRGASRPSLSRRDQCLRASEARG